MTGAELVLVLDLLGTFAFALNGAFAASRVVKLDIVGVLLVGGVSAVGGGIMRDILIGAIPPAAFQSWPYLATAAAGSCCLFLFHKPPRIIQNTFQVIDAAGLALFCVAGAQKALNYGLEPVPAILMGTTTGVGGGILRDIMIAKVPDVFTKGFYAIPATLGATFLVLSHATGYEEPVMAVLAAVLCFGVRCYAMIERLDAPVAEPFKPLPWRPWRKPRREGKDG